MLTGTLLAESLRVGHDLRVADLVVTRLGRHDVSRSTAPSAEQPRADGDGAVDGQPDVWTFVDFAAPDERAAELADALAAALLPDLGWYADFTVAGDHVVVFAGRVFRYRIGDAAGRRAAVEHGLAAGTPAHQLDWGD
jgi:hypothetical protein